MRDEDIATLFRFFTEVGIINQLGSTVVESHLPADLTSTHFGIVGHLSRRPDGETPLQLAHAFQLPKTTMTHMLKVLQRHDLIHIGPNPADGRSKLVTATARAPAFLNDAVTRMVPDMATVLDKLGVESFAALLPELERIRAVLDAARD